MYEKANKKGRVASSKGKGSEGKANKKGRVAASKGKGSKGRVTEGRVAASKGKGSGEKVAANEGRVSGGRVAVSKGRVQRKVGNEKKVADVEAAVAKKGERATEKNPKPLPSKPIQPCGKEVNVPHARKGDCANIRLAKCSGPCVTTKNMEVDTAEAKRTTVCVAGEEKNGARLVEKNRRGSEDTCQTKSGND